MNSAAQILRGRFRRAARLAGGLALEIPDALTEEQRIAGGLALEIPDALTEEQRIALERCVADMERVLARAALTLGVEVLP